MSPSGLRPPNRTQRAAYLSRSRSGSADRMRSGSSGSSCGSAGSAVTLPMVASTTLIPRESAPASPLAPVRSGQRVTGCYRH
jgi:hypothetical protein